RIVQSPNGTRREWKHTKLADVIQVPDVLRNSPITIEKNRWHGKLCLRQNAPPRPPRTKVPQATRAPPQSRSLQKHLSCIDDPSDIAAKNTASNTASPARLCTSASPAPYQTDRSAQKSPPPAIRPPMPHASPPNRCR